MIEEAYQERVWTLIYGKLVALFSQFGEEECTGAGDFWVVDDNYGWSRSTVFVNNLRLLTPWMVTTVQSFLEGVPDWTIVLVVAVDGEGERWPDMGVTIREHEIIDTLQREYLPPPYNRLEFPGSRPGTGYD
ncbi:hypothetical protein X566_15845 [Afipia sp. P52-10]|jgi:hypothetical protein|uniref:hypothetical protein n=1 Tax=Afipia sp. P52-10 TaxID=1429916 RepID=UPI0003DF4393|nr:hypothetical protein [Afipia sp. P52-10]ETR76408.1 hypothetical protein X566_15845 [Afipia sp. P52-10]